MEDQPSPTSSGDTTVRAWRGWGGLLALYWPERRLLAISTLFWLVKSSPTWALPVITANLIDIVSAPARHRPSALWWNAAWGTVFILQHAVTHAWHYDTLSLAVRRVENRLRSELCRHLQQLSVAYHRQMGHGTLQTKVLRDVENIGLALREFYNGGLYALFTALVTVGVVAWRAPGFVPVLLLTTPVAAGLYQLVRGKLGELDHRFRQETERLAARVLGMLHMVPITRAHAVEDHELDQIGSRLGEVQHAGWQLDRRYGQAHAAAWVVFTQFSLAGLVLTAWLSYRRILPLSPGDVALLSGYFGAMTTVLIGFLSMLPTVSRGLEGIRSLGEVLDSEDLEDRRGKRPLHLVHGSVEFRHVRFVYPGQRTGEAALADFSLRVEAGETIGIVGASGAGKSTLLGLLLGFHRPVGGQILIDGVRLDQVDLPSYRRQLAVVSQETLLFEGTVRENILYGLRDVPEGALRDAVEAANAAEFVARLPHGLDTPLGEGGARLSGGERQRIAIARALVRSPRLLILDEATSALDSESESLVQEALDRLMAGRTTFIVAHRLSTLRKARRIAVLKAGRLVELGSPASLRSRPAGEFARFHRLQAVAGRGLAEVPLHADVALGELEAPEHTSERGYLLRTDLRAAERPLP